PLQAGSWLMSILAGFGAAPSSLTVPETEATVAGSIGVAAGAGAAAFSSGAFEDCSVFSFLLHPASTSRPRTPRRPDKANHFFRFMISQPFLVVLRLLAKPYILSRSTDSCRARRHRPLVSLSHFGTRGLCWCVIGCLRASHRR